jgi:hypothetical protein
VLWHTHKNTSPVSQETHEIHARLLARHASKYPNGIPPAIVSILFACARKLALYPEYSTREHGQKLMRQRMAKAAHKAIRAKGMQPCQAANEARKRYAEARKAKDRGELPIGSSNTDGI